MLSNSKVLSRPTLLKCLQVIFIQIIMRVLKSLGLALETKRDQRKGVGSLCEGMGSDSSLF